MEFPGPNSLRRFLGQSLEEITPKETEPVVQQEEVPLTVVPSSTSTAAESLASENSAATSAGSSQETVQPATKSNSYSWFGLGKY